MNPGVPSLSKVSSYLFFSVSVTSFSSLLSKDFNWPMAYAKLLRGLNVPLFHRSPISYFSPSKTTLFCKIFSAVLLISDLPLVEQLDAYDSIFHHVFTCYDNWSAAIVSCVDALISQVIFLGSGRLEVQPKEFALPRGQ